MMKLKSFIMVIAIVVGMLTIKVEAATVAVLPLINKVEFQTVEEERVPNLIFTQQAIGVLKAKPGFMLVENERLKHTIRNHVKPYELPQKEQMAAICKQANVDILFAMELLNYDYSILEGALDSRTMKMNVRANLISYNRLTNSYVKKECLDNTEIDETFSSRWDVVQESWIRMVRQEMDRITRVKKR